MESTDLSNIGKRLVEVRKQAGLNQAEFAARYGVSKNSQLDYEKGNTAPGGSYLAALAADGHDLRYILLGTGASTWPQVVAEPSERYAISTGWPDPELDLLHQIVLVLETELQETNQELDPADKADFIKLAYKMLTRRLAQLPERKAGEDPLDKAEIIDLMEVANFRRR